MSSSLMVLNNNKLRGCGGIRQEVTLDLIKPNSPFDLKL